MNLTRIRVTLTTKGVGVIEKATQAFRNSLTIRNLGGYRRVDETLMKLYPGAMRKVKMIKKKKGGGHGEEKRKNILKCLQTTWLM